MALDKDFWNNRYLTHQTGWDLGAVSPAFVHHFEHHYYPPNTRILIPGAGNAYEAEFLLQKGFTTIHIVDISSVLIEILSKRFANHSRIALHCGDFFEHVGEYDLILEQTFFCALDPSYRQQYVKHMHRLLSDQGLLIGLLFNRDFDGGPPFGGNEEEYRSLFSCYFTLQHLAVSTHSASPRLGTELWIEFRKKFF
jgi:Thiopurine S-methyltransferase (TPMT).